MIVLLISEKDDKEVLYEDCLKYISKNGKHFNKALCDFAVSKMMKGGLSIIPMTLELVDVILNKYGIDFSNLKNYDRVFVANMCKADFYGSSIISEAHMAMFIQDYLNDEDGYDGIAFCRWKADMKAKDVAINWESYI